MPRPRAHSRPRSSSTGRLMYDIGGPAWTRGAQSPWWRFRLGFTCPVENSGRPGVDVRGDPAAGRRENLGRWDGVLNFVRERCFCQARDKTGWSMGQHMQRSELASSGGASYPIDGRAFALHLRH